MFKLFIILSFVAIGFTSAKYIKKRDKLNCPFVYPTGEPCKRSHEFRRKIARKIVEQNLRPDILHSNMTEAQRHEEHLCCYETEGLRQCQNYLRTIDEDKWSYLLAVSGSLARLNRHFFKNYRPLESIDENVNRKDLVEEWQIRVAHFYLNEMDLNMASKLIGYVPDKL